MTDQYTQFHLRKDEVECVKEFLDGEYNQDAILLAHSATLLVPSLIGYGLFKNNESIKSVFEFSSKEVAVGCRLMSLDLYGMMHGIVLKSWGLRTYNDLNKILLSIEILDKSESTIIARKVSHCSFKEDFFGIDPVFDLDPLREIEIAGDVLINAYRISKIKAQGIDPKEFTDEDEQDSPDQISGFSNRPEEDT